MTPAHPLNWYAGWCLILSAFITGAGLGLFFHRDDFWGGYGSFRRRIVRLGHIALAALGMMNVLYSLSPWPRLRSDPSAVAATGFAAGALLMPAVCFLTGWRPAFRRLFFIPVVALVVAVAAVLYGSST